MHQAGILRIWGSNSSGSRQPLTLCSKQNPTKILPALQRAFNGWFCKAHFGKRLKIPLHISKVPSTYIFGLKSEKWGHCKSFLRASLSQMQFSQRQTVLPMRVLYQLIGGVYIPCSQMLSWYQKVREWETRCEPALKWVKQQSVKQTKYCR